MKILLVRPETPKNSINLQSFMICEPLELEYAYSSLTQVGNQVDLVDMLLEKQSFKQLFLKKKYDMVCFTSYITNVGVVKKYAETVKRMRPDCLTFVGGVHAEVVPDDFIDPSIDFIGWANGIKTLTQLTLDYPNIDTSKIGGVYVEGRQKPKPDTSELPFPDRKVTAKYRDFYNYIYHDKCATIKTSYGCPYKCNFCFCTRVCDYRVRDLESVLDELEAIEEQNVFIVDDDFLVCPERLRRFCDGLDRRNIKKHYIAFGRADFIAENEYVIKLLHSHGFDAFFVGIESFKNSELNDFSKRSTVEVNTRAVNFLEKNGLICYSGLIVGEDWIKDDFDTLIAHLNRFEHPLVNIQPITPMPGTPLYGEYGYEITESRENYASWDMAHVVFRPIKMSKRMYYYHIIRAYLKTSANKKQRKFIKATYGKEIYNRVKKGAAKIFFQYLKLMINPNI